MTQQPTQPPGQTPPQTPTQSAAQPQAQQAGHVQAKVPDAIRMKIEELKRLETELGHLPPETWAVSELQRRTVDPDFPFHAAQMEQQTELLFGDICDELSELGLAPAGIATVINGTLQYPGGPKYCNEFEVAESLGLVAGAPK